MLVETTNSVGGHKLVYAKDAPVYEAPDSHALRNLDTHMERWLRFEIEVTPENLLHMSIYNP